jgi:hypothetical protein
VKRLLRRQRRSIRLTEKTQRRDRYSVRKRTDTWQACRRHLFLPEIKQSCSEITVAMKRASLTKPPAPTCVRPRGSTPRHVRSWCQGLAGSPRARGLDATQLKERLPQQLSARRVDQSIQPQPQPWLAAHPSGGVKACGAAHRRRTECQVFAHATPIWLLRRSE